MTIRIQQCFNGERTGAVRTHRVTTQRGLERILSHYQMGNGWGVHLDPTDSDLPPLRLSLTDDGVWVLDRIRIRTRFDA